MKMNMKIFCPIQVNDLKHFHDFFRFLINFYFFTISAQLKKV